MNPSLIAVLLASNNAVHHGSYHQHVCDPNLTYEALARCQEGQSAGVLGGVIAIIYLILALIAVFVMCKVLVEMSELDK